MNILDFIIIIFLAFGALIGFKQGFTKSVVKFFGTLVVIILSFLLKNPVSELFMNIMPFFPFGGYIKGVTVLNILLYEVLAFAFIFSILMVLFKVLLKVSGIFERLLSLTIIFGIPSKILGALFEVLKNYVIVFFALYFISLPNFSEVSFVRNSKLKDPILKSTPVLSNCINNSLKVIDEFGLLSDKYKRALSADEFNLETLDLFLKYKITTVENIDNLRNNGKINIKGIDSVLDKYK